MSTITVFAFLGLLTPGGICAQQPTATTATLSGVVVEAETGLPLAHALLRIEGIAATPHADPAFETLTVRPANSSFAVSPARALR